jgi:hypothetical protein
MSGRYIPVIVVDLETTGLAPPPAETELARRAGEGL